MKKFSERVDESCYLFLKLVDKFGAFIKPVTYSFMYLFDLTYVLSS